MYFVGCVLLKRKTEIGYERPTFRLWQVELL